MVVNVVNVLLEGQKRRGGGGASVSGAAKGAPR